MTIQAFTCVLFNIPFIEMVPQFKCQLVGSTDVYDCKEADFCGRSDVSFWIDKTNPLSFYNWAQ